MITYRDALKSDLKTIAELLTESFSRYLLFEMYVADEDKRLKFIKAIHDMHTKVCFKNQTVLVGVKDDEIVAVAILKAPGIPENNIFDYVLSGGLNVLFAGGVFSSFGFLGMSNEVNAKCNMQYPDSWYLSTLAISSPCQGQGLGGKMINECIKPYIKSQGGDMCTLVTHTEGNHNFYIKNGFTQFHSQVIRRNKKELNNWSYKVDLNPELL